MYVFFKKKIKINTLKYTSLIFKWKQFEKAVYNTKTLILLDVGKGFFFKKKKSNSIVHNLLKPNKKEFNYNSWKLPRKILYLVYIYNILLKNYSCANFYIKKKSYELIYQLINSKIKI